MPCAIKFLFDLHDKELSYESIAHRTIILLTFTLCRSRAEFFNSLGRLMELVIVLRSLFPAGDGGRGLLDQVAVDRDPVTSSGRPRLAMTRGQDSLRGSKPDGERQ